MNGARRHPAQRPGWAGRFARRAAAHIRIATVLVHRGHAVLAARAAVGSDRVVVGGRRRTVAQVQARCALLAMAVHGGPHPSPAGRPLRFAGRGLTLTNTVTLAFAVGGLDGAPTGPGPWLSAMLAAVVSGVQTGLVLDLGRRLRPYVGRPARLSAAHAVEMGLLVALSGLVAVAGDQWARATVAGDGGVAAGLLFATAAVAAPLMILSEELYGPGAPARRLRRAERALTRIDRRCRRLDRRGRRFLDAAHRRLRHAEQLLVLAAEMTGDGDPAVVGLGAQIDELGAWIRTVWRAYTDAVPPLDPDDLDLAG